MAAMMEVVDLEGQLDDADNVNTEPLPDDEALFAPYTYSHTLCKER